MARVQEIQQWMRKAGQDGYWAAFYTQGYSTTAGVGNGIATSQEGGSFELAFGVEFCNNAKSGLLITYLYPLAFNQLKKSKHY